MLNFVLFLAPPRKPEPIPGYPAAEILESVTEATLTPLQVAEIVVPFAVIDSEVHEVTPVSELPSCVKAPTTDL
jgi:hypothetical protein